MEQKYFRIFKYNVDKILFQVQQQFINRQKKLNENDKIKLLNPYAETKFYSEKIIRIYSKLFNISQ